MKILISETNEIKTLTINDDPTDSILNDFKDVDDFMIIDDGRDDYQGGADFEMTQDNFTWWSYACAACNTANELLASYAQKYPANLLDAILDKHYNIGPFDSDGTDKIELVNKYFGNTPNNTYHEVKDISLSNVDSSKLVMGFTVTDVMMPTAAVGNTQFVEIDLKAQVVAYKEADGQLKINHDSLVVDCRGVDCRDDTAWFANYFNEIVFQARTNEMLSLKDACNDVISKAA